MNKKKLKWWDSKEFNTLYKEPDERTGQMRKEGKIIYPAAGHVGSAFILTDPEDVRIVIMGQDPYYGTDYKGTPHAHGLAFSTQSKVSVPPTLKNIIKELFLEYDKTGRPPDLTDWAIQGVLLLNTQLTVEKGKPNSHEGMWDDLIKCVIQIVSNIRPIVFMLWGNSALQIWPWINNREKHLILETSHPSPHSAHRGFFGCQHFLKANEWLIARGEEPIRWI